MYAISKPKNLSIVTGIKFKLAPSIILFLTRNSNFFKVIFFVNILFTIVEFHLKKEFV